jgi:hypothetical protein
MTMNLGLTTIISRNQDILANSIGNETVMMSVEAGKYFGTNKTGSYIWKLLENPLSFGELCDKISEDFNISREQSITDVKPYIEELSKENIILLQ